MGELICSLKMLCTLHLTSTSKNV